MRRWWVLALLLLALVGLQLKLWWGEGGLHEARVLEQRVGDQRAENARLQQRNDALSAEVEDLKSGEAAVEDRARSELGMIKPGETFYRVVEPRPAGADDGEDAREEDDAAPPADAAAPEDRDSDEAGPVPGAVA
ncbi:cell division protein FtsB [Arenimonas sp. MALMAid1274]|uniref:cell division protein FtsB n=1 Tax=Arenimonas sp. MALMAid1274 TaxID=3411630 RepID=UPI003B9E0F19